LSIQPEEENKTIQISRNLNSKRTVLKKPCYEEGDKEEERDHQSFTKHSSTIEKKTLLSSESMSHIMLFMTRFSKVSANTFLLANERTSYDLVKDSLLFEIDCRSP